MATISFYLRGITKTKKQGSVIVRFTHNREHFERTTGVVVGVKDFDAATGRVSAKVDSAANLNTRIEVVRSRIENAAERIYVKGLEPTPEHIRAAWDALVEREQTLVRIAPKVALVNRTLEDDLRADIAHLEVQLAAKREELHHHLSFASGDNDKLIMNLVKHFLELSRPAPLKIATVKNYEVLQRLLEKSYPTLTIDEVNADTLIKMRDELSKTRRNSTVGEILLRLKAVIRAFADKYDLDIRWFTKVKVAAAEQDKPVVYLTPQELVGIENIALHKPRQRYIRDLFLLSCYTGLRHIDLHISEDNIQDDYIRVFASKTSSQVELPFSSRAKAAMERMASNPARYEKQLVGNFSADVKKICASVEALQKEIPISMALPAPGEKVKKAPKWKLVSSKAGRKTFINNCLLNNIKIEVVANWVGHKSLDMILNHYSHKKSQSEAERFKLEAI